MTDYSVLKVQLRGDLIQPGDGSYDEARKLYNVPASGAATVAS